MRCPKCNFSDAVRTIESRHQKASGGVRRRRECSRCLIRWTTEEQIVSPSTRISKPRPRPKRQPAPPEPPAAAADRPSCHACAHWRDHRCGFDFPDPLEEGPGFGAECDLYEEVSQSISLA